MENTNVQQAFEKEIMEKLSEKLSIKNPMALPKLKKIVINMSTKDFLGNKGNFEKAKEELGMITGQKPRVAKARISVATFKLREGDQIGLTVTLRGARMYNFYEKLVKVVLPRVRDFSGVNDKSFDGRGNLTIGFNEYIVFPEIDPGKIDKMRSLQVIIATSAKNNEEGRALLEATGMPFRK
jgi:large subunit ribosomal protein L5